jgi:hypothetical protein
MKKTVLMLFALSMLFVACEKDVNYVTFNYPVSGDYTKVDVSGAFDVMLCDTVSKIVVTAPESSQQYVDIYVRDGVLKIKYRFNLSWRKHDAKVLLPANKNISEVELSGASTFRGDLMGEEIELDLSGASDFFGSVQGTKIELDLSGASNFGGTLQGSNIDMDLSGASDMAGSIDADNIKMELSGASTIKAKGSCLDNLEMDLSGSSDFLSPEMECRIVTGEMSGSSDAEFCVCESLQVSLSGSSDIVYGIPAGCRPLINCSTSGGSSVTMR